MLKFKRRAIALSVSSVVLGIAISGTALALSSVKTSNGTTKTFSFIGSSATPQTVLRMDGLVMKASCAPTTGLPVIAATTSDTQADIFGHVVSPDSTVHAFGNDAFSSAGGPVDLTGGVSGDPDGSGTAVFERSNGQVVTVTYGFDNPPTLGTTNNDCTFFGSAIAS